jgi:sodium-coupled monocarboxylate transporter 8/12
MVVCLLIVAVNGIVDEDGLANIFSRANEGGRLALFDFNLDMFTRQTFWTLYFGGIFLSSVTYCFDQIGLQRFQAAKTKRQAKLSVLLNVPGTFLFISLCCFSGLIIYAKYQNCDPLYKKNITNANQYLSYYVLENFYTIPGMIGIYLGGVFCSSLSSLSSYLNSQAAIIFQDFFLLFNYFRSLNDKARLQVNKLIVLVCGCVVAALTYVISSSGNNLIQLSSAFNGTFNAPIVGLFLLSLFFSVVNKHGALGGFVIGLCVNCWINVGSLLERPVYPPLDVSIFGCPNNDSMLNSTTINFNYMKVEPVGFNKFYALANSFYTAFGAIVTVVAGLLISVFTGGLHNRVDESLLIFDLTWFLNRKTYT